MPIPMMKNNGSMKLYNIVTDDADNSAVVEMYGEVVDTHPVDWWTEKPVAGNFIALDEFLSDLAQLQGKSSITVHINSVGGDFFAGLAIYNRLRTLNASITTINDSLAASAGSIIFMAGDKGKRKVHAASNLMVHGVMGFMYGYYNVSDLKSAIKTLQAHDKALIAVYTEATGLDEDTVKAAISKDTYMTGKEAVELGWADEVISDEGMEPVNMKLNPDKSCLMVNGYAVAARCFGKLPDSIPQMSAEEWAELSEPTAKGSVSPAPQVDIDNNSTGGNHMAEIKSMEDLRAAYPDLIGQVENAAKASERAEGVNAERARIQSIEAIEAAIGDKDMVREAKYGENPLTAEQLAFKAMQAQASIGATVLTKLENDTQNSGAAGVVATPAPASEPKALTEDEQAEALLVGAIPANMKKEDK